MSIYKQLFTALLICTACLTHADSDTDAKNVVGTVVLSVGKNIAQLPKQPERSLKRKSALYAQDTLQTGSEGRLQVRFSDKSRLSLRPDTTFKIEEYRFQKEAPEKGESSYRLIKGGLRTITGAISDANTDNYRVHTPIATIGVRGTHYSLFYCDKSCKGILRSKEGLYGYVLEGEIQVATESVKAPVQTGRYFFLGKDGNTLQIRKTPFGLFETLKDLGPDLLGSDIGSGTIPALELEQDKSAPYSNAPRGSNFNPTGSP